MSDFIEIETSDNEPDDLPAEPRPFWSGRAVTLCKMIGLGMWAVFAGIVVFAPDEFDGARTWRVFNALQQASFWLALLFTAVCVAVAVVRDERTNG